MPESMGTSSDRESWLCHLSREGFDSGFEQILGSSVNSPYMLPCEDTLLQLYDGKSQLGHAPAAKKDVKQVIKNIKNVTRCRDSRTAKRKQWRRKMLGDRGVLS